MQLGEPHATIACPLALTSVTIRLLRRIRTICGRPHSICSPYSKRYMMKSLQYDYRQFPNHHPTTSVGPQTLATIISPYTFIWPARRSKCRRRSSSCRASICCVRKVYIHIIYANNTNKYRYSHFSQFRWRFHTMHGHQLPVNYRVTDVRVCQIAAAMATGEQQGTERRQ